MKKSVSLVISLLLLLVFCFPMSTALATTDCDCGHTHESQHVHSSEEIISPLRAEPCDYCANGTIRPHSRTEREPIGICPVVNWQMHYRVTVYNDYICDSCGAFGYSVFDRTCYECTAGNCF